MRESACSSFAASFWSLVHGTRVSLDALGGQKWRERVAGIRGWRHAFRKRRSDDFVALQHDSLTTTFHARFLPLTTHAMQLRGAFGPPEATDIRPGW